MPTVPPINAPSFLRRLILALVHMRAVLIGSLPADPKQARPFATPGSGWPAWSNA